MDLKDKIEYLQRMGGTSISVSLGFGFLLLFLNFFPAFSAPSLEETFTKAHHRLMEGDKTGAGLLLQNLQNKLKSPSVSLDFDPKKLFSFLIDGTGVPKIQVSNPFLSGILQSLMEKHLSKKSMRQFLTIYFSTPFQGVPHLDLGSISEWTSVINLGVVFFMVLERNHQEEILFMFDRMARYYALEGRTFYLNELVNINRLKDYLKNPHSAQYIRLLAIFIEPQDYQAGLPPFLKNSIILEEYLENFKKYIYPYLLKDRHNSSLCEEDLWDSVFSVKVGGLESSFANLVLLLSEKEGPFDWNPQTILSFLSHPDLHLWTRHYLLEKSYPQIFEQIAPHVIGIALGDGFSRLYSYLERPRRIQRLSKQIKSYPNLSLEQRRQLDLEIDDLAYSEYGNKEYYIGDVLANSWRYEVLRSMRDANPSIKLILEKRLFQRIKKLGNYVSKQFDQYASPLPPVYEKGWFTKIEGKRYKNLVDIKVPVYETSELKNVYKGSLDLDKYLARFSLMEGLEITVAFTKDTYWLQREKHVDRKQLIFVKDFIRELAVTPLESRYWQFVLIRLISQWQQLYPESNHLLLKWLRPDGDRILVNVVLTEWADSHSYKILPKDLFDRVSWVLEEKEGNFQLSRSFVYLLYAREDILPRSMEDVQKMENYLKLLANKSKDGLIKKGTVQEITEQVNQFLQRSPQVNRLREVRQKVKFSNTTCRALRSSSFYR